MAQFFAEASKIAGDRIMIDGPDYNHLKNVLRMKPGEKLTVSDGGTHIYACELTGFLDGAAEVRILSEAADTELRSKLRLFQGLPKADKMELIIQKAVELGVYEIVPVSMKRCIVKLDEKKEESKLKRYLSISESAAKQSGRGIVPEVKRVMSMKEALRYASECCDHVLVPYEKAGDMQATRDILEDIEPGQSVGVFIGPEGGFEESEIAEAEAAGARVITLGRRILRTETAGLAVLSALMFRLEE